MEPKEKLLFEHIVNAEKIISKHAIATPIVYSKKLSKAIGIKKIKEKKILLLLKEPFMEELLPLYLPKKIKNILKVLRRF